MAAPIVQGKSLEINPLKYIERLQSFDGKPEDLAIFIQNVDDIIPTLREYNDQGQRMCINVLKSKFVGRAKQAIEIHSHLESWDDIKDMLLKHFSGFENSFQLYDDLRASQFRGDVINFYNYIQKTLSMLNQKSLQENKASEIPQNAKTALNIFKERLPVHMRTILYALKPTSMQEALHELTSAGFVTRQGQSENKKSNLNEPRQQNKNPFRQNPTNNNFQGNNNFQNNFQNRNNNNFRTNFQNNRSNNFRQDNYSQNYNRNYNPNNYRQRPQQFEPMDVDPSGQHRQTTQAQPKTNFVNENENSVNENKNFRYAASDHELDYPLLN